MPWNFYCHWVEIFNLKMCFGIQAFVWESFKGIRSCISIVIAGRSEAGMREAARLLFLYLHVAHS